MVEPTTLEVPETAEEEFGLVEGPLGHLTDESLDERFFNAAAWEQLLWDEPARPEACLTDDLTLQI